MLIHTNTYACTVDLQEMIKAIKLLVEFYDAVDGPWVHLP